MNKKSLNIFNLSAIHLIRLSITTIMTIILVTCLVPFAFAQGDSITQVNFNISLQTEVGEINLKAENSDIPAYENPKFELAKHYSSGFDGISQRTATLADSFKGIFTDDSTHEVKIEAVYKASSDVIYSQTVTYESAPNEIEIANTNLIPGTYTLIVTDITTGTNITQNFTWGVLAINTEKSIYKPDETAKIALAVLDEKGDMVCDALVKLNITDPEGNTLTMSTENQTIKRNLEICQSKDYTLTPDYETLYQTGIPGVYKIKMEAVTENGQYVIEDSFKVEENPEFEVKRLSATRIYPVNIYPMIISVVAKSDYEGTVSEKVPEGF